MAAQQAGQAGAVSRITILRNIFEVWSWEIMGRQSGNRVGVEIWQGKAGEGKAGKGKHGKGKPGKTNSGRGIRRMWRSDV